ncbi:ABC transporter substrate-binding protein [Corynebacterium confusum]
MIDWNVFEHTWKFNYGEMDELNIHSTEGFDKSESITPGENDKQVVVKFKQAYPWWQDTFSFLLPPQVDSAGGFDATNVAAKERLATIQDMDNIEIRAAIRPANVLFVMNSDAPGLDDIKVREAFMTAIDRDPLASIRFNDLDYEEDLPGSFTLYQTQEGYQDSFDELISFDPEKAKQLLDDAGWAPGADGTHERDGEPLALRYVFTGDDPGIKAEASATQKILADVGIKLNIEERPSAEFSKIVTKRDFGIFPMAFASSSPLGVASFNQIYASDSELNKSGTGTRRWIPRSRSWARSRTRMSRPRRPTSWRRRRCPPSASCR